MQIITKYKAEDGKEFSTDTECYTYEKKLNAIKAIEKTFLPVRPDSFSGYDGYLLHDKDLLVNAMKDLIVLCNIPDELKNAALKDPFRYRHSVLGRYLDEGGDPCRRLWYRFMCIDDYYREWGQPYYALNPEKGNQKKLN